MSLFSGLDWPSLSLLREPLRPQKLLLVVKFQVPAPCLRRASRLLTLTPILTTVQTKQVSLWTSSFNGPTEIPDRILTRDPLTCPLKGYVLRPYPYLALRPACLTDVNIACLCHPLLFPRLVHLFRLLFLLVFPVMAVLDFWNV